MWHELRKRNVQRSLTTSGDDDADEEYINDKDMDGVVNKL